MQSSQTDLIYKFYWNWNALMVSFMIFKLHTINNRKQRRNTETKYTINSKQRLRFRLILIDSKETVDIIIIIIKQWISNY